MTTAPRISGSGPQPGGIGPVVRPALLATLGVGVVAAVAGGLSAGSAGLFGAVIGITMVAVFFGFGAVVLQVVATLAPAASLLIALLTYTLKVVLIGLVFLALSGSGALDSTVSADWLGGTVIAGTFAWITMQLRASTRVRIPAYDLPAPEASGSAATGPADDASGSISRGKEAGAR